MRCPFLLMQHAETWLSRMCLGASGSIHSHRYDYAREHARRTFAQAQAASHTNMNVTRSSSFNTPRIASSTRNDVNSMRWCDDVHHYLHPDATNAVSCSTHPIDRQGIFQSPFRIRLLVKAVHRGPQPLTSIREAVPVDINAIAMTVPQKH